MTTRIIILCLISFQALISCTSSADKASGSDRHDNTALSPLQQLDYDTKHYWDNFNFKDTTCLSRPKEELERLFAPWVEMSLTLYYENGTTYSGDVAKRASTNESMLVRFMEMADMCFRNPVSPYRCEELYIPMLQEAISAPINSDHKISYKSRLETALMNRKGTIATDINFITDSGKKGTLHSISSSRTLLYFFNPDCNDCARVGEIIKTDGTINALIDTDRLKVIALYPDEEMASWNNHLQENPPTWVTARYANDCEREKYDLPAIPNLYLLGPEKDVLLKDASIEEIISYLAIH